MNLTQSLAYLNSTPHPCTSRNPENDPGPYPCWACSEDRWPNTACEHCDADVDLIGWDADEDAFMENRGRCG